MNDVKILLVEDERVVALDIKQTLESFGYHVPYIASNGEDAIEKASSIMPDLILMDIIIAGDYDGIETASQIKDLNIPIIYLTAHSEESTIEKARQTEPYAYLIKPYDKKQLKFSIELAISKNRLETELKESEKKYRSIIETVLDAFLRGDSKGRIIMASPSAARIFRYDSADEMIGISVLSLYKSAKDRQKMFVELKKHGKVENFECEGLRKDGTSFWESMNVQYIYDKQGKIQCTESFIRDITSTKKAKMKLERSESGYRAIFENTGTAILTFKEDGKIILVNSEWERLSGYSREEVEGKMNWKDLVHPDYLEKMIEYHKNRTKDPETVPNKYETIFRKKNGKHLFMYVNVTSLPGTDQWLSSSLDITDLHNTQKKLEKNVLRMRALTEFAVEGIITTDANGKILYYNNSLHDMFGYSKKELKNSQLTMLMPERFRKKFMAGLKKFRSTGEHGLVGKTIETLGLKKEGTEFPFEMSLTKWEIEKKIYFTSYIRDISERKMAEKTIQESYFEKEIISNVAMQLVAVKNFSEIFLIIGKAIKELLPQSYVIISSRTSDPAKMCVKEIFGLEKYSDKLKSILGRNIYEIEFPFEAIKGEYLEKFESGLLIKQDDGLYSTSMGKIPRPICKLMEKVLNISEVYGTGFSWAGNNFGALIIALKNDKPLEHKDAIETIVHQASIAIQRYDAEEATKDSLAEKEVLLREIHHRVKNNMQIVSSLLNLQMEYVEDEKAENVLKESQGRIKSMAIIHEKLYQSTNLTYIHFKEYVEKLVYDIYYSYGIKNNSIKSILDIEDIHLNIETSIPLGLIVNELVTNIIKYAFPQNEGNITITLKSLPEKIEFTIADNGIGLPKNFDLTNIDTLGLQLVKNLVKQLDGELKLNRNEGTEFKICFKELNYEERL